MTAVWSANRSAARPIMSAIVVDPVVSVARGAVLDSMRSSPPAGTTERDSRCGARSGRRNASGGGYLTSAARDGVELAEVREEQRLVDATLEDRHAHFHALLDDLATLHAGLARKFRGREMDCHQTDASCEVCHVASHGSAADGRHQQQLLNTR